MRMAFYTAAVAAATPLIMAAHAEMLPPLVAVTPFNALAAIGCTTGDRCVISDNHGGQIELFVLAGKLIHQGHFTKPVVISGPCMSGCATAADLGRPNVCITPSASFLFHKAFHVLNTRVAYRGPASEIPTIGRFFIPPHSKDIGDWISNHGGFPDPDLQRGESAMLTMPYDHARKFFPDCRIN
jgi:hypothetical protein